jgi:hypothetical protein
MNLDGWQLSSFTQILGSKDPAVLEAATARLSETLRDASSLAYRRAARRSSGI